MNEQIISLIVLVSIVIIAAITFIIYKVSLPKLTNIVNNKDTLDNLNMYLNQLYKNTDQNTDITTIVNIDNLSWIWINASKDLQEKYKTTENLSFSWPPKKGEKYKMTAFPYPDTGESNFWLFKFIKGMHSLLDNTADQVTFPGWQISIYEPMEPNYNSWQNFLEKHLKWVGTDPITTINTQKTTLTNGLYMEVLHACYSPPDYNYPTCDDGGYWLYGASGSGVFWSCLSISQTSSEGGGCLVANNKIDALFKLWNYAKYKSDKDSDNTMKTILLNMQKIANLSQDKVLKAEDYICARLKNTGGGMSLVAAMKKLILKSSDQKPKPQITAFRTMKPSKSYNGYKQFVFFIVFFISILLGVFSYLIYTIVEVIKHKKPWYNILIIISSLFVLSLLFYQFLWNISLETLLRGFGYQTLDMALKDSNLSLEDFVFSCAGLDKNYTKLDKKLYNPIPNGLAQIQLFDFDLSFLSGILKLDSVVMHAQPNKSGSWAVEIIDLRNTPVTTKSKSLDDLVYSLGLCGSPLDGTTDNMPELKQGPITKSPLYFGYQPTGVCKCDDSKVLKQYKKTGDVKKCLYCENSFSDKLC